MGMSPRGSQNRVRTIEGEGNKMLTISLYSNPQDDANTAGVIVVSMTDVHITEVKTVRGGECRKSKDAVESGKEESPRS